MTSYTIKYLSRETNPETGDMVFIPKEDILEANSAVDALNIKFGSSATSIMQLFNYMITTTYEIVDVV